MKPIIVINEKVRLQDANVVVRDWGHARTGSFDLRLHRALDVELPAFIEFEGGEKRGITFTRIQGRERNVRVQFAIKDDGSKRPE